MDNNISLFSFINNKYSLEDYVESLTTTIAIFFILYLFVVIRSNYIIAFLILVAIIFTFIYKIKEKYKNMYNLRIMLLKKKNRYFEKKNYKNY